MAAFDTPWLSSMSKSSTYTSTNGPLSPQQTYDPNPLTVAAFSPTSSSGYSAASKQRSTIIVHKKSPLLVATPPQITRALAHSHPFLLPLNKVVGLLSWSTDDPWESYIMVAAFWGISLYGGTIIRFASPIIVVTMLILGMYSRRYSPLSSTTKTGEKHESKGHKRELSEVPSSPHHKSLDEIVDTLQEFTTRCNILLGPFLEMTDFLSTQRTPTSATTRPALTTLFIRILLVTPLWVSLMLPPFHILTPRRVILTAGTIVLTWHSRPARVSRAILWRSVLLRKVSHFVTGLNFDKSESAETKNTLLQQTLPSKKKSQTNLASEVATKRRPDSSGVRFTFILYENQRRWIGLGWTTSLFAYERGPWTDEHLNAAPSKDEFELPEVEGGYSRWRWIDKSEWRIEHGDSKQHQRSASQNKTGPTSATPKDKAGDGGGWIYYDNKWNDGKREDGWGRYTRRRKWFRDAELVEMTPSTEITPSHSPLHGPSDTEEEKVKKAKNFAQGLSPSNTTPAVAADAPKAAANDIAVVKEKEEDSSSVKAKRKSGWFSTRDRSDSKSSSGKNTGILSARSDRSRDGPEEDVLDRYRDTGSGQRGFSVQEDVFMGLG